MSDDLDDLGRLRAAIDRIDDTVVDLLVERMGHVQAIAVAKGFGARQASDGRLAIRPAREAAILRRLTARSDGIVPVEALVRIWREIISAATSRQTPFAVVVAASPEHADLVELARDHFGTTTPLLQVERNSQALALLDSREAAVAVFGLLDRDPPWWIQTSRASWADCSVFGRVPFVRSGNSPQAWLFGPVLPEPTGDDMSLIRIAVVPNLDRQQLLGRLHDVDVPIRHLQSCADADRHVHLIEAEGFFVPDDAALADLLIPLRHEMLQCTVLGAYPRGITAADGRSASGDPTQPRREHP